MTGNGPLATGPGPIPAALAESASLARLYADHGPMRRLLRKIEVLDAELFEVGSGTESPEIYRAMARMLDEEIDLHFRMEEEVLFPALRARSLRGIGDEVDALVADHRRIRAHVGPVVEMLRTLGERGVCPDTFRVMESDGRPLVALATDHTEREDALFTRVWARAFDPETDRELLRTLAEMDRSFFANRPAGEVILFPPEMPSGCSLSEGGDAHADDHANAPSALFLASRHLFAVINTGAQRPRPPVERTMAGRQSLPIAPSTVARSARSDQEKDPVQDPYDEPLEVLMTFHRDLLAALDRLDALFGDLTRLPDAGEIASILRFYRVSGAAHVADEEESLFPRIFMLGDRELLTRCLILEREHRDWDRRFGQALEEVLEALSSGSEPSVDTRREWIRRASEFGAHFREHIRIENEVVFRRIESRLTRDLKDEIGDEIRARHARLENGDCPHA